MHSGAANSASEFAITGMTCSNCARHVMEAIQSVPGVSNADIDLAGQHASIRWTQGSTHSAAAVIHAVEQAGYEAREIEHSESGHAEHRLSGWTLNLWIGALGTLPLMLGEWVFGLGLTPWFQWVSFLLAGIVQVIAGSRFYLGAWRQLKTFSSNMDTLVALGSTTAFAYSVWALFAGLGGHLYFMEAAAIITLVSTGHWMESRVSVRASSALRKLLDLAPRTARRRAHDGTETEVPVASLKIGDLVALRPGDHVPTDAIVVEGASSVDESMLTGESVPVDKAKESELFAGTSNINGRLLMRVTATGEQTALAHIIVAVQRAQTSRAGIQRLGDRVSNVFVPLVVVVAIAAGLWWGLANGAAQQTHDWLARFLWHAHVPAGTLAAGVIIAAAVLIIACPCAMGLATPAAIMAGSNAAAERGILIRDGVALEKAGKITTILFDKTGTLTIGKPTVVKVWRNPAVSLPGQPSADQESPDQEDSVAHLAASLARHSAHPVSLAIAAISKGSLQFKDWEEIHGAGVRATDPIPMSMSRDQPGVRELLRLGALRWLEEAGVDSLPGKDFVNEWSQQGATIVGLSIGRTLSGLFAIKDTLKPGAQAMVAQLRRQGLKTCLVTGDNKLTAASVAKQLGIQEVFAEVRPEQKADLVRKLQQKGDRVAFAGDGINDAPALEQADLGIAVSRASDIAREAADIVLLKSDIEAVPESLGLARATLRAIKQNLFWAFFYNAVGVPLAALGFMNPVLCAAAMGLSDLVVIGNALRLRRWRLR